MKRSYIIVLLLLVIFAVFLAILTDNGKGSLNDSNRSDNKEPLLKTEQNSEDPPPFEALFAIAGLLAVAFLVLRQQK